MYWDSELCIEKSLLIVSSPTGYSFSRWIVHYRLILFGVLTVEDCRELIPGGDPHVAAGNLVFW
jgi:hypothetical protein